MKRKPKSILTVDTDISREKQLEAQLSAHSDWRHRHSPVASPRPEQCTGTDSDGRWTVAGKHFGSWSQQLLTELEVNAKRGAMVLSAWFARMKGERTILSSGTCLKKLSKLRKRYFPNPSKSIQTYRQTFDCLCRCNSTASGADEPLR